MFSPALLLPMRVPVRVCSTLATAPATAAAAASQLRVIFEEIGVSDMSMFMLGADLLNVAGQLSQLFCLAVIGGRVYGEYVYPAARVCTSADTASSVAHAW